MDLLDKESTVSKKFVIGKESQDVIISLSKWSKFLAYIGFFMGVLLVAGLVMYYLASLRNIKFQQDFGMIFAISAVVYFVPSNYLFKGADRLRMGVDKFKALDIREGFEYLKSMYRFMGIYFIVMTLITLYRFRKEIILFFS